MSSQPACHCLLLEREDGLVLIDTGLGTADLAQPRRRLGPLAVDDDARRHNQARLRELRRSHGSDVRLFCAHDPAELSRAIEGAAAA